MIIIVEDEGMLSNQTHSQTQQSGHRQARSKTQSAGNDIANACAPAWSFHRFGPVKSGDGGHGTVNNDKPRQACQVKDTMTLAADPLPRLFALSAAAASPWRTEFPPWEPGPNERVRHSVQLSAVVCRPDLVGVTLQGASGAKLRKIHTGPLILPVAGFAAGLWSPMLCAELCRG